MHIEKMRERCEALAGAANVRGRAGRVLDEVIAALDRGALRVAEPDGNGGWTTNAWIKRAILLYFQRRQVERMGTRDDVLVYHDKLPVKRNYQKLGVRCVPPGVARYGSFLGTRRDPDAGLREYRRVRRRRHDGRHLGDRRVVRADR